MRRHFLLAFIVLSAILGRPAFAQYNLQSISYLYPALPQNATEVGDPLPGDYNNDGHIDIALPALPATIRGSGFVILLGSGLGAFNAQAFIAPPNDPCAPSGATCSAQAIRKGDFNRDGKLDLILFENVTTGSGSSAVSTYKAYLFLGKGDATFQPGRDISQYLGPDGKARVIDVRENGKLDLVGHIISNGAAAFQIALGNGDGTFQDPVVIPCPNNDCTQAFGMADLGNGHMDIVYAFSTGYGVMLGNGDGTFQKAIEYPNTVRQGMHGSFVQQIVFGRFSPGNKIGMVMLVAIENAEQIYAAEVYNGNGDGTFADSLEVHHGGSEEIIGGIVATDINNDGADDLVLNPVDAGLSGFDWFLANADGTFAARQAVGTNTSTCGGVSGARPPIQPADITGSGWKDIVSYYPATQNGGTCLFLLFNTNGPRVATTTTLTSSNNPQTFPATVTLTAKVTGNSPAKRNGPTVPPGGVNLYNNGKLLGNRPLKSGVATFANLTLPVGDVNLTATYSGDNYYLSSSSLPFSQVVQGAPVTVSTTFTPASDSTVFSNPITMQVKVAGQFTLNGKSYTPSGAVLFYLNNKAIATRTLTRGTATLTTSIPPLGSNRLYAAYTGDTWFAGISSTATQFMVTPIPTSISLVTSASPVTRGSQVTFTATLSHAPAPDPAQPNGALYFYDGTTFLGAGRLQSGIASITTAALAPGTHTITAKYPSGSTAYAPSTSNALSQIVN
jgi:hypothetical protein